MGKQQANTGEGAAASNIQFFTKQELMEQEYASEIKVSERYIGYSNPLVTSRLQAAVEGRPEALKWGVDKIKAVAYFAVVPAGTPGAKALRIVGNSFQFAMRKALQQLKVPMPKGMNAYMPVEVQNVDGLGVALVINAKTPRYETAPPKKPRTSKKTQQHDAKGQQTAQPPGAAAANAPASGDAAPKDPGAKGQR